VDGESMRQRCYGGVRLLSEGPSAINVARLDAGCLPMAHHMAMRGIQVDLGHFQQMVGVLAEEMERLTADVSGLAGHYVNPGSGDQVAAFLFKELGLKQARQKYTKGGDRESVENEVLVAIRHLHPAVAKILKYKEVEKLKGTYAEPILALAKHTAFGKWRLFPHLKTTRTPTGRFSADDPNLLAMPNRSALGRRLCEGFITDPGWVLLSVDESQIEPRTVAHRSQDANLMAVYANHEDIYSDFAISAFRLPDTRYQDAQGTWVYPGVDKKKHRFPSKTCTLASIYRVTSIGLVEQMPVVCKNCGVEASEHESKDCWVGFEALWNEDNCQDIINRFYLRYPGITRMQVADDRRARRHGYVWDDWGRLAHAAAVHSTHEWVVSQALRELGNMPIQGFACGTLKLAMAAIYADMVDAGLFGRATAAPWASETAVAHPLLPIHDEILAEVREDYAADLGELMAERFRTCVELTVPLDAEWKTAECWGKIVK
jgi:DNA polymerase-1